MVSVHTYLQVTRLLEGISLCSHSRYVMASCENYECVDDSECNVDADRTSWSAVGCAYFHTLRPYSVEHLYLVSTILIQT